MMNSFPLFDERADKPAYIVPSMASLATVPRNGRQVVSLFAGCGGSSLGYKLAGFRVAWANEFVPAAAAVYALNHPGTVLDQRDIRKVHPAEILASTGLQRGQIDILDGSPPCCSFSRSGKRAKGWGTVHQYSARRQRTDDLFHEYRRILSGLLPLVFVAENVPGLAEGKAKPFYHALLDSLTACGYRVGAQILDAQAFGVPQVRRRLFIIGVRKDLQQQPAFPVPLSYRYTVRDAWASLSTVDSEREQLSPRMAAWYAATQPGAGLDTGRQALEGTRAGYNRIRMAWEKPSPTVLGKSPSSGTRDLYHPDLPATPTIAELKRVCGFPDDFQLVGTFKEQWERMGRAVPPPLMAAIARTIFDEVFNDDRSNSDQGGQSTPLAI